MFVWAVNKDRFQLWNELLPLCIFLDLDKFYGNNICIYITELLTIVKTPLNKESGFYVIFGYANGWPWDQWLRPFFIKHERAIVYVKLLEAFVLNLRAALLIAYALWP